MKKWQKLLRNKILSLAKKKAKRRGTKKRFYMDCVQYVKKQRGFILPHETSYVKLAKLLEGYANSQSFGADYERCLIAAGKLNIALPNNFYLKDGKLCKHAIPAHERRSNFYSSLKWKKLRYQTIVKYGARCQCCGATGRETAIRVDHIKPISKYWHLRLDPDNLQVLCNECNWGKLNYDKTDWR